MNIRYPIYEGVYRILTAISPHSVTVCNRWLSVAAVAWASAPYIVCRKRNHRRSGIRGGRENTVWAYNDIPAAAFVVASAD